MLLVYCGITRTITFSPYIKPYRTFRPPALLRIPYISLIPLLFVIVIVRSTYLSRSQIVDSQGLSPFPWCSVVLKQSRTSSSCIIVPFNISTTLFIYIFLIFMHWYYAYYLLVSLVLFGVLPCTFFFPLL